MDESEIANYADDNTPYPIDDDIEKVKIKLKLDHLNVVSWSSANEVQ